MTITNKNDKRSQKGRSMVEMLGVLAIVGVLSVGGVYGYGVAMKKHKANELLHQASMLATTISAQAMSNDGKLPETITDFGSTSYGKFPTTVGETADKTGFTITISEIDGSVCSQLKKGGMVQNVDCNPDAKTATITYYKNLATTEAEGKKSPTGGSGDEPYVPCKEPSCCPEGTKFDSSWGYCIDSKEENILLGCSGVVTQSPPSGYVSTCKQYGLILTAGASCWYCMSGCLESGETIIKDGYCQCAPGHTWDGDGACEAPL